MYEIKSNRPAMQCNVMPCNAVECSRMKYRTAARRAHVFEFGLFVRGRHLRDYYSSYIVGSRLYGGRFQLLCSSIPLVPTVAKGIIPCVPTTKPRREGGLLQDRSSSPNK